MEYQRKMKIEKRLLATGFKYIVREARYLDLSAPYHAIDHGAHSSFEAALAECVRLSLKPEAP